MKLRILMCTLVAIFAISGCHKANAQVVTTTTPKVTIAKLHRDGKPDKSTAVVVSTTSITIVGVNDGHSTGTSLVLPIYTIAGTAHPNSAILPGPLQIVSDAVVNVTGPNSGQISVGMGLGYKLINYKGWGLSGYVLAKGLNTSSWTFTGNNPIYFGIGLTIPLGSL